MLKPASNNLPYTYDKYGRLQYHPDLHARQKMPWTTEEELNLIENYEKVGPEQMSFELERTIHTVMTRACKLRKAGKMPKPSSRITHKRMFKPTKTELA